MAAYTLEVLPSEMVVTLKVALSPTRKPMRLNRVGIQLRRGAMSADSAADLQKTAAAMPVDVRGRILTIRRPVRPQTLTSRAEERRKLTTISTPHTATFWVSAAVSLRTSPVSAAATARRKVMKRRHPVTTQQR